MVEGERRWSLGVVPPGTLGLVWLAGRPWDAVG